MFYEFVSPHSHQRRGDFTSLAAPTDPSQFKTPRKKNFFLFVRKKTQGPKRWGIRRDKERAESGKGSRKRPVSPHLQPELRLKCGSQHRRPVTHIEPSAARQTRRRRECRSRRPGEKERHEMCKKNEREKKKQTRYDQTSAKRKCRSRL